MCSRSENTGWFSKRACSTNNEILKIIARVNPADIVHDDAYESDELEGSYYEGWTHIDRVFRSSGDKKWQKLRGWVGTRFLKFISYSTCHDSNL